MTSSEADDESAIDSDAFPVDDHHVSLSEPAEEAINREIESCQDRIVRVLVPTIISFGIATIGQLRGGAGGPLSYDFLFGALFAVLFSSSLYIASMSYKIFERAAFLRALTDRTADWETVIRMYRKRYSPRIIGSETTTISWIYMLLAVMFGALFWGEVWTPAVVGATLILFVIAFRTWLIPRHRSETRTARRVRDVLESFEE